MHKVPGTIRFLGYTLSQELQQKIIKKTITLNIAASSDEGAKHVAGQSHNANLL